MKNAYITVFPILFKTNKHIKSAVDQQIGYYTVGASNTGFVDSLV